VAFWKFIGTTAQAFPEHAIVASPGEVYSFGAEGPPPAPISSNTDNGAAPANAASALWVSDSGPTTAASVITDARSFRAPTGALAVTMDRGSIASMGSLGLLTSGTPRSSLIGFAKPTTVTAFHFVTGTTAAITPTHWWVALTDSAGAVVAVSADQLTAPIAASTAFSVAFPAPVPLPAGRYYAVLVVVAGGVPTLLAVTGLYNAVALPPVTDGNSATTGQTVPPAIGATIAAPASQSTSAPFFWIT
jgi:hypothetical protein